MEKSREMIQNIWMSLIIEIAGKSRNRNTIIICFSGSFRHGGKRGVWDTGYKIWGVESVENAGLTVENVGSTQPCT